MSELLKVVATGKVQPHIPYQIFLAQRKSETAIKDNRLDLHINYVVWPDTEIQTEMQFYIS